MRMTMLSWVVTALKMKTECRNGSIYLFSCENSNKIFQKMTIIISCKNITTYEPRRYVRNLHKGRKIHCAKTFGRFHCSGSVHFYLNCSLQVNSREQPVKLSRYHSTNAWTDTVKPWQASTTANETRLTKQFSENEFWTFNSRIPSNS